MRENQPPSLEEQLFHNPNVFVVHSADAPFGTATINGREIPIISCRRRRDKYGMLQEFAAVLINGKKTFLSGIVS